MFNSDKEAKDFRKQFLAGEIDQRLKAKPLPEKTEEQKAYDAVMERVLSYPPFSEFLTKYLEESIKGRDNTMAHANEVNEANRIKHIGDTVVQYYPKSEATASVGALERFQKPYTDKLKNVPIQFIDHRCINSYIKARLTAGKAKSTVKRELNTISASINFIFHLYPDFYNENFLNRNPVKFHDKKLLAGYQTIRVRRITPEEEDSILKALWEYSNKDVYKIFALALATGLRRSEVVTLRKGQINLKTGLIELKRTKANIPRTARITPEAREVLRVIDLNNEKLFSLTVEGFATAWDRIKKKHFDDVKFHDTRKEFINKALEKMNSPSAIAITQLTGMSDAQYVQNTYLENMQGLDTEKGIMKSAGHGRLNTTKGYTG